jgi:hypothetical protein
MSPCMSDTVSGLANALEAVPRTPFSKRERNSPSLILVSLRLGLCARDVRRL